MEDVVSVIHENGIGQITLNRPKALNSLNTSMLMKIKETLTAWRNDDRVVVILLDGAGEKGFCAGGDIKMLYAAKDSEAKKLEALTFFEVEYNVDLMVAEYPKPIVAILDGIVMGGGVGLSYGASHRIITEKTKWAMPEMNIGFFPDVGAAYFLNQTPGYIGRYLALTSEVIAKEDILYSRAADHYIETANLTEFMEAFLQGDWKANNINDSITTFIQDFESSLAMEKSNLARFKEKIDQHFSYETVEAIIASLSRDSDTFSVQIKETILSKSPTSVKVTLQQLIRGEGESLKTCLATDKIIAKRFLSHDDFYEGVRSVIIDKDQNPQYQYHKLSDVTDQLVESFFQK
ncbi:enoyl-CoA hydratase/isomerase family protein [Pseudogracilibacillus sp. SO30301A]|uniref:enoyl-CoA hydratase/isomerase family protein n=1 Tax=Pseudogracilibacillus sp. SO30301A TaxID=3098291 RepID=UPI00300E6521